MWCHDLLLLDFLYPDHHCCLIIIWCDVTPHYQLDVDHNSWWRCHLALVPPEYFLLTLRGPATTPTFYHQHLNVSFIIPLNTKHQPNVYHLHSNLPPPRQGVIYCWYHYQFDMVRPARHYRLLLLPGLSLWKNLIPRDHDIQYIIIWSRPIGLVFGFPKSGLDFHCGGCWRRCCSNVILQLQRIPTFQNQHQPIGGHFGMLDMRFEGSRLSCRSSHLSE